MGKAIIVDTDFSACAVAVLNQENALDLSSYTSYAAYIAAATNKWVTGTQSTCLVIPIEEDWESVTMYSSSRTLSSGAIASRIGFLSSFSTIVNNASANVIGNLDDTTTYISGQVLSDIEIPSNAAYLYVAARNTDGLQDFTPNAIIINKTES